MPGWVDVLLLLGRRAWDRLFAPDPGRIRLRLALRTTTALALTFAVLHSLSLAARLPGSIIVLGVVESLFGSVSVRDPEARQQRATLLLTPLPAAAAFALGTALAPFKLWSDLVFLVIIFAAVYARRFGARATALGFLAFIPYYIGNYLHLPVTQLPYQMISLAIGTGCAYLVRFHIVPDRPEQVLVHALQDFDERIGRLLAEIDKAVVAGAWDRRRRRRLRHHIGRLNETALIAEDQLDQCDTGRFLSDPDKHRLRLRILDLELAADRLAYAAFRDLPPADLWQKMSARVETLGGCFRGSLPSPLRRCEPGAQTAFAAALQAAERAPQAPGMRFAHALAAMEVAANGSPEPDGNTAPPPQPEANPPARAAGGDGDSQDGTLRPTTRQAIQVTVACTLAILAGEFLSPHRWYWAVLTAFVVFSGTQSRGDTLIRAGQRVIGTVIGVAVGIAVAHAVSGTVGVSLLLIYICVFLAYYTFQVAYGTMMFWISIIVALLYQTIGVLSTSLLLLRVEETAIGAAIGVAVAVLLLPISTTAKTGAALREFLQRLSEAVERATRHMAGEEGALDVAGVSRDLDRAFQTLRTTAHPLASGLAGAVARTAIRRFLTVLRACSYYAHNLARLSGQESAGESPELARLLVKTAARIRRNSETLADLIEHKGAPIAAPADLLARVEEKVAARYDSDPRRRAAPDRQAGALYDADHIDEALQFLARDLASRARDRGGAAL
ncbi:MAG TPA: FUSC family protein [Stellaceae bacterium]|nr:FUSC family protein [Stellaceae bacterium]